MFGKSHSQHWRGKRSVSNVGGSLRKYSESKLGNGVAIDQILSVNSGLVPQEKGLPTRANIWGGTVFCIVQHIG